MCSKISTKRLNLSAASRKSKANLLAHTKKLKTHGIVRMNVTEVSSSMQNRGYGWVKYKWKCSRLSNLSFPKQCMKIIYFERNNTKGTTKRMLQCCMLHGTKSHMSALHCSICLTACSIQSIQFIFHVVIFSWDMAEEVLIGFIVLEVLEDDEKQPTVRGKIHKWMKRRQ